MFRPAENQVREYANLDLPKMEFDVHEFKTSVCKESVRIKHATKIPKSKIQSEKTIHLFVSGKAYKRWATNLIKKLVQYHSIRRIWSQIFWIITGL